MSSHVTSIYASSGCACCEDIYRHHTHTVILSITHSGDVFWRTLYTYIMACVHKDHNIFTNNVQITEYLRCCAVRMCGEGGGGGGQTVWAEIQAGLGKMK